LQISWREPRDPGSDRGASPDQPEIPSRAFPLPAVAPERRFVASRAAGQHHDVADSGPGELQAGGSRQIQVRLSRRTGDGDLRPARGDDLRRHLVPHLVAAGPDRRPHPGGPLRRPPLHPLQHLLQGEGDDPAHDPPPSRVDGRDPPGSGDQDGHAVGGDHRQRDPRLLRVQGIPLAAEPRLSRQRDRRMDLLRPGERRRRRLDPPQHLRALPLWTPAGEADLDIAVAGLPDPGAGLEGGALEEGRGDREHTRDCSGPRAFAGKGSREYINDLECRSTGSLGRVAVYGKV
jgi:hypothetical protein